MSDNIVSRRLNSRQDDATIIIEELSRPDGASRLPALVWSRYSQKHQDPVVKALAITAYIVKE
jgi:hypothetical protein